ncbi:MAG TPA: sigma-70 family RNA polymerase sigma factor [Urbifossiella sp.]|jgi:RNA polymerase sigma factor (sigma-70 family)|nr:sigma-70 family RNA polymerase sigma factor [Urbifossiella sp.]
MTAARFPTPLARFVPPDAPADADLLARFVAARDDDAFAELVRRHGPAVLAVCRRITTRTHDAEDAFQATFLVLARKAHVVRSGEPVGAWLYGVAVRAARKAAVRVFRRHDRETLVAAVPEAPVRAAEPFDPDTARAVVEEVGRLSPKYRAAVVLCELEGRPRSAAARELGIAEGTLSSRLADARKRLAARLSARGFGPAALATLAGVAVPPGLAASASAYSTGSAPVVSLAHGVIRTMFLQKLKLVSLATAVVATAALAAAGLVAAPPAPAGPAAPAARVAGAQPPAAKAVPKGPNRILMFREGQLTLTDPDGKNPTTAGEPVPAAAFPSEARVSPDGALVAYCLQHRQAGARRKLLLHSTRGDGPAVDTGAYAQTVAWAPDGKALAATDFEFPGGQLKCVHYVLDLATRKRTPLALPDDHILSDWSADGRYFVTQQFRLTAEKKPNQLVHLMNRDGTPHRQVNNPDDMLMSGRLSPDGRRMLCVLTPTVVGTAPPPIQLVVLTVADGAVTTVVGSVVLGDFPGYCWSPDGARIAYISRSRVSGENGDEIAYRLVVCNADGTNPQTITTAKGPSPAAGLLVGPEWR